MSNNVFISTPLDDYELVDFGQGRKLERFGPYLIERPDPRATGPCAQDHWRADWVYKRYGAKEQWQARDPGLPKSWSVVVNHQRFNLEIGSHYDIGLNPEQIACWHWTHERLSGCYHLQQLRCLNLFGGVGGVSSVACREGASVVHVETRRHVLSQAKGNLDNADIQWVWEDPHSYVDQALRNGDRFELIVFRPTARQTAQRGSWDISCDLNPLVAKLQRLVSKQCRGFWFAPRELERGKEWHGEALEYLVRDYFPGLAVHYSNLGLTTRDGRVLRTGVAAHWVDEGLASELGEDAQALDATAIEERLDNYLDPVLSSRRTAAAPAIALAPFSRQQQEFVLRWVDIICRSNAEMAYQFCEQVSHALQAMDEAMAEEWILQAMDVFDTSGLHPGIAALKAIDRFVEKAKARNSAVEFDQVATVLDLFVQGLSGRHLKLEAADRWYTDTETLYLPHSLNVFDNRDDNFALFKAIATQLWAQTWMGSYREDLTPAFANHEDPARALQHFQVLERLRLDAVIARTLPGLWKQICHLCAKQRQAVVPPGWEGYAQRLALMGSTVKDSLATLHEVYAQAIPDRVCYQGDMDIARVSRIQQERKQREKEALQVMLLRMVEDSQPQDQPTPEETAPAPRIQITADSVDADGQAQDYTFTVDGKPMAPPAEAQGLLSSILQDFGEIPPEYLVAAGSGGYKLDPRQEQDRSQDVWKGTYHEEGAFLYNEWDHKRQHYRKNWCVMRESDVLPKDAGFVDKTLHKYSGLVKNIRRTFEVLRGDDKRLKRQTYGDEVDIDALVETLADVQVGMEMSDRLFTHKDKLERNIAVMFMVDMSGSTKGWINDAERESLVLLCEALEHLGDRYAIYGFSGTTRKRCELFRIKRFDEHYSEEVKGRISGILPKDYTRMGVTIRHLSKLLNEVDARTRVLITLSDGKPDDFDGYRNEYGIEDTRMALLEAKRDGIHPFCITIDSEAHDYLPHMYGAVSYTVIDEVRKLPLKVSDIYRKLTT